MAGRESACRTSLRYAATYVVAAAGVIGITRTHRQANNEHAPIPADLEHEQVSPLSKRSKCTVEADERSYLKARSRSKTRVSDEASLHWHSAASAAERRACDQSPIFSS